MADDFLYDVFLSHSSQDKAVARDVAERLKKDGLRVWLDEWEIRGGDHIPTMIEAGLKRSRVLVLCMSANGFGSDWTQLELGQFQIDDPLNKDRHYIVLRLDDDAPIEDSLMKQFRYISWLPDEREQAIAELLEFCGPSVKAKAVCAMSASMQVEEKAPDLSHGNRTRTLLSNRAVVSLIAIVIVAVVLRQVIRHRQREELTPTVSRASVTSPLTITSPSEKEKVAYIDEEAGGKFVTIKGQIKGFTSDMVILLTTLPLSEAEVDRIERPQFAGGLVRPDPNGAWSSQIQVGNTEISSPDGSTFRVRAYIITESMYDEIKKNDKRFTNMANADAEVTFTLQNKEPAS